jgi:hypothetical protein
VTDHLKKEAVTDRSQNWNANQQNLHPRNKRNTVYDSEDIYKLSNLMRIRQKIQLALSIQTARARLAAGRHRSYLTGR